MPIPNKKWFRQIAPVQFLSQEKKTKPFNKEKGRIVSTMSNVDITCHSWGDYGTMDWAVVFGVVTVGEQCWGEVTCVEPESGEWPRDWWILIRPLLGKLSPQQIKTHNANLLISITRSSRGDTLIGRKQTNEWFHKLRQWGLRHRSRHVFCMYVYCNN